MPEIKHQFTGGKMNKDVDERLVPSGEYRDAMNIQVSTSEGSDVGTIQNILGNEIGCTTFNGTFSTNADGETIPNSYIPHLSSFDNTPLARTVGSIADEKNDIMYWLIGGVGSDAARLFYVDPFNYGGGTFPLPVGESSSAKDMIVQLHVGSGTCKPVFVDKHEYCVGYDSSGVGNSIILGDSSQYANIHSGMTVNTYGWNGTGTYVIDSDVPINGIGNVTTLPVNFTSQFTSTSSPFTPPSIQIGDHNQNTKMNVRGFWNGTTYTNIHFSQTDYDLPNKPNVQTNLPPDGASQFWIAKSDIPLNHNITPGSIISKNTSGATVLNPGIHPQAYHAFNAGTNVLNNQQTITVYTIVLGEVIDHTGVPIQAWIITVGILGGIYDEINQGSGGINRVQIGWSDDTGTFYNNMNWFSGIWQKTATIAAGYQNAEAHPFMPLQATITPTTIQTTVNTPTEVINIMTSSSAWLDEIYNAIWDENGNATGSVLTIDNNVGAGVNFPPNSCIDPATVTAPPPYDSQFSIVTCGTSTPAPPLYPTLGALPLTFNIVGGSIQGVILSEDVNFDNVEVICFKSKRVLNFPFQGDIDTYIHNIDIIDDMMFWTGIPNQNWMQNQSNTTEPKKINISRSRQGTHQSGETHTAIINSALNYNSTTNYNPIREEHITVIRKNPKNALNLELDSGRDPDLQYTGITRVGSSSALTAINASSNPNTQLDFSSIEVGDIISFYIISAYSGPIPIDLQWESGGYLLLDEFNANGAPTIPLVNWTIRGLITESANNNFENISGGLVLVEIEVVAKKGNPSAPNSSTTGDPLHYVVDYEDTQPIIFEDKFPRFSYRYKYEDGEYSTYAPWSEVAFLPKGFDYNPQKGWNTGMLSNLKSIKVKGFHYPPTYGTSVNRDVVSVDILYKEDSSPNVYLIDTISPKDIIPTGSTNKWYNNEYLIKSERIKGILPSNQLLRSWDNVPTEALAQSVTGNRIVYGNYFSGYDIGIDNANGTHRNYIPDFKSSLTTWAAPENGVPLKSIKSLRDYKLGVVFTDIYGRETPVLIGENGGFRVEKTDSINANRLKVGLHGGVPKEMAYYKFYIKETSSEYYNLAMDRWYKAEDGNLWLAFPSSDRNKIDIDTYLYFKKGVDADNNVIENSTKYKVLAIENEAPEFIKTRNIRIGSVTHFQGTAQIFGLPGAPLQDAPAVSGISFTMDYAAGGFGGTSLSKMEDIKEDIYIQFKSSVDSSKQYKVSEITSDADKQALAGVPPTKYFVTLDTAFLDDIDFIFDQPTPGNSRVNDDVIVMFTKAVIENKPKFDGRFFAKIENDGKIQTQITDDSFGVNYIETTSKMVYALEDDAVLKDASIAACMLNGSNLVSADYGINPVTDWGIDVLRNPAGGGVSSGLNFNYKIARDMFFTDSTPWHNSPSLGSISSPLKLAFERVYKGLNDKNEYSDDSNDLDMGVWFIDKSTKKWGITTQGVSDNDLDWPDTGYPTDSPVGENMVGWTDRSNTVGPGILNSSSADTSTIALGFGGFSHPRDGDWKKWWAGDYCGPEYYLQTPIAEFFGVGALNDNCNDPLTTEFVESINPGFQFRWKEDPNETIYKIENQTSYERDLRFGKYDEGFTCPTNEAIADGSTGYKQTGFLIQAPSSYTKTFGFKVTPSMNGWDPAQPVNTYMQNGLTLGPGVYYTKTVAVGAAIGATSITCTDVDDVKIGMSAGQTTGVDQLAKVINVDALNNIITLDIPITGALAFFATVKFGFSIRITLEHIYGLTGNTISPKENYIIVDGIQTECSNISPRLKSIYSLHKGMKLDEYNLDTGLTTANDLVIKAISTSAPDSITNAPRYRLSIAGYSKPINDNAQGQNLTTDFTLGERLSFRQVSMNGVSNFTEFNTGLSQPQDPENSFAMKLGNICAVGYRMQIMEGVDDYGDGGNLPENPFVWETEPREDSNLDIYHEISENNPTQLNRETINTTIPLGSTVVNSSGKGSTWNNITVSNNNFANGRTIQVSELVWIGPGPASDGTNPLAAGDILSITKPNGVSFDIEISAIIPSQFQASVSREFVFNLVLVSATYSLNWHNCYSFGNGVESNRVKDTFNSPFISNGVKASSTISQVYEREHKKYGLIYSGIYNSKSENNLNQFIAAEKITKEINPTYGSIQKLHSRSTADGDLIVLCEDRVLKILAEKDALFNADGNPQLTATNKVLGQAIPFSGNYGISRNPESFASESYRAYFTDKVRGAVIRLSKDGLTAISDAGMKDWFRDNLKLNSRLIGSYDAKKEEYNVTINNFTESFGYGVVVVDGSTASFREDVRGWVSFKSFVPENAISCANEYYTFIKGTPWLHHVEKFNNLGKEINRNTFYGVAKDSTFNVILNDMPGIVKSFNTINYEGSQSKVDQFLIDAGTGLSDGEYYNLNSKSGWYVDSISTNKEVGKIPEFIEKEGKWFNYIKGQNVQLAGQYILMDPNGDSTYDQDSFSIQGLGIVDTMPDPTLIAACTDPTALNYNSSAGLDDGSCTYAITGCTDPTASNYNSSANTDNGSCYLLGCTDSTAINYNSLATSDDNSCIAAVYGCSNTSASNYNSLVNVDNNSCVYAVYGCMDSTQFNYDPSATEDDSNCIPFIYGCTNNQYINYNPLANTDDGSCFGLGNGGCTDPSALNYDSSALTDDGSCSYTVIIIGCTDPSSNNYDSTANIDDGSCIYPGCTDALANNYNSLANTDDGTCQYLGCTDSLANNYDSNANVDNGSCDYCVDGCTDSLADNYNTSATCDDGSCTYPVIGCMSFAYLEFNPNATIDDPSLCLTLINNGCTDPSSCNYDSLANVDNGTCLTYYGCMDSLASNYDANATCNDNCQYLNLGCTDPLANNYDSDANNDDGSCTYDVFGCTDSLATNYASLANIDDGSCGYSGCTSPGAANYNSLAQTDDGSCVYAIVQNLQVGDTHEGGIIFWLDGNGGGLIAAPSDQAPSQWGCPNTWQASVNPALGQGQNNTNAIIAGCSTANIAAKRAKDYSVGGYSDWFLGTTEEMFLLFDGIGPNATGINSNGTSNSNIGNFVPNSFYWSSRQSWTSTNSSAVAYASKSDQQETDSALKTDAHRVRAIRSFGINYW